MPREHPPRDRDRVEHVLKAAREAVSFTGGRVQEDLDSDRMLIRAVLHAIGEIGEAARHVSEQGRARFGLMDWRAIVDVWNVPVYVQSGVRTGRVWQTVQHDLPPLIAECERVLSAWPPEPEPE